MTEGPAGRLATGPAGCHLWAMQGDRFDLAVVGAGLSGSLLALAAGEAGLDTVLIDRVPAEVAHRRGLRRTDHRHRLHQPAPVRGAGRLAGAGRPGRAHSRHPHLRRRPRWPAEPDVPPLRPSRSRRRGRERGADGLDRREPLFARGAAAPAGGLPACRAGGAGRGDGDQARSRPRRARAEKRPAARDASGGVGRGPLRHHARGCRHRRPRLVVRPGRHRAGGAP